AGRGGAWIVWSWGLSSLRPRPGRSGGPAACGVLGGPDGSAYRYLNIRWRTFSPERAGQTRGGGGSRLAGAGAARGRVGGLRGAGALGGGGAYVVGRPGGRGVADEGLGELGDVPLVVLVSGDVGSVPFAFFQVGAGEPVGFG